MKKNYKILIVLILAVVLAIIASMFIVSYLTPRRATIYVFKSAYPIGTQITSDMLIPIQVDSGMIVAGRNTSINERMVTSNDIRALLESGDSLKVSVGEGTPLMRSLLSISGGNSIMMSMSPSSVAVTINVDNTTGITQELYSGAAVNVFVTAYSGNTFLLFENMRVLDIHRNQNNGSLTSVTLEVTNEEAVKLINSSRNGAIHLGLINPSGYQYEAGTSEILVNPESSEAKETDKPDGAKEEETVLTPETESQDETTAEGETEESKEPDEAVIQP